MIQGFLSQTAAAERRRAEGAMRGMEQREWTAGEQGALLDRVGVAAGRLLLEEDYADLPRDEEGLRAWLERLSLDGRRSVVLTGVSLRPGAIGAGCFDRATGRIRFAMARQEPAQFPGTGDLFASVVLGAMLRGEPLETAAQRAAEFVQRCAAHTLALGTPVLEGVQFEPLLGELMQR